LKVCTRLSRGLDKGGKDMPLRHKTDMANADDTRWWRPAERLLRKSIVRPRVAQAGVRYALYRSRVRLHPVPIRWGHHNVQEASRRLACERASAHVHLRRGVGEFGVRQVNA
jgi:hypothetical protein